MLSIVSNQSVHVLLIIYSLPAALKLLRITKSEMRFLNADSMSEVNVDEKHAFIREYVAAVVLILIPMSSGRLEEMNP